VETARKHFEKALELRPGHPEASRGLAIVLHHLGRTQDAVKLFANFSRAEGPDALLTQALMQLGLDPGQAGPVKAALGNIGTLPYEYQRALQFCAVGMADYLLGDLESAQRNLKTARVNDSAMRFPGIRLHLAKVEETRRNWGPAREELEQLRKDGRFRQDPPVLFLLALNAYHRSDVGEMNWFLREVERLRPDAPDVLLFRASQETNELDRRGMYQRVLQVDPGNLLAHYNLGTIRLRLEDTQAAIADFQAALRSLPDFREARLNLANAYRQAQQYQQAAKEYQELLNKWPEMDDARLGLALVYLESGQRGEAEKMLQEISREGSIGAMAQLLLARRSLTEGKVDQALELTQQAVDMDPGSYQARTFLGDIYLNLNEPAKAIPHFQEASRNPNDVSFPDAVNGMAVAYHLQGDYARALEELDRVLRRPGEWGNAAAFFVNRGNVYFRQKQYNEAEADYAEAQARDGASPIASYNLGVLKEQLRDSERARIHYREAIRRQPAFPKAHFNLGNLYAAIQDRESAIEEYRRASEDDPEIDAAYVNLAIQLIEGGEYREAVEHLERASERSPRSTLISNALAIIHLQMGDLARAEEECSQSLAVDPVNAPGRLLMGLVRMAEGRFSEAQSLLIAISPDQQLDLSLQSSLGVVNVSLGNVRAGIQSLENAMALARGSARGRRFRGEALVNLAWGLLREGDYERVRQTLEEAQTHLEAGKAEDVRATLRQLQNV